MLPSDKLMPLSGVDKCFAIHLHALIGFYNLNDYYYNWLMITQIFRRKITSKCVDKWVGLPLTGFSDGKFDQ